MTEKEILESIRNEFDNMAPDNFKSIENKIRKKTISFKIILKSAVAAAILALPVVTVKYTNSLNPLDPQNKPIAEITTVVSHKKTTPFSESITYTTTDTTTDIPKTEIYFTDTGTPTGTIDTTFTQELQSDTALSENIDTSSVISYMTTPSLTISESQSTDINHEIDSDVTTDKTTISKTTEKTVPDTSIQLATTITTTTPKTEHTTTGYADTDIFIESTSATRPSTTTVAIPVTTTAKTQMYPTAANTSDCTIPTPPETSIQSPVLSDQPSSSPLPVTTNPTPEQNVQVTTPKKPSGNNNVAASPPASIKSFSIYFMEDSDNPNTGLDTFSFSDEKYIYTVYFVSRYRIIVTYENKTITYSLRTVLNSGIISPKELYENGLPAVLTPIS